MFRELRGFLVWSYFSVIVIDNQMGELIKSGENVEQFLDTQYGAFSKKKIGEFAPWEILNIHRLKHETILCVIPWGKSCDIIYHMKHKFVNFCFPLGTICVINTNPSRPIIEWNCMKIYCYLNLIVGNFNVGTISTRSITS